MKKIRLWKLGSLEYKISPTQETASKLCDILSSLKDENGNFTDIIWGPDIEVLEIPKDSIEGFIVEKIEKISEDTIVITANKVQF